MTWESQTVRKDGAILLVFIDLTQFIYRNLQIALTKLDLDGYYENLAVLRKIDSIAT